jgi:hypothetical protein
MVAADRPSIICIQETKLYVIHDFDALQMIGSGYDFSYLPAAETHGAILVAFSLH